MDAFSVSLANGLNEPEMKGKKMYGIAGVFAFFQALMPMVGWICVHTIVQYFRAFEKFIPWIALLLLTLIGGNMLAEGIKKQEEEVKEKKLGMAVLLMQGIATSIDALSVGFTISEYGFFMALACALIIAIVTFVICMTILNLITFIMLDAVALMVIGNVYLSYFAAGICFYIGLAGVLLTVVGVRRANLKEDITIRIEKRGVLT